MDGVFFRMANINKFYQMGEEDMQVLKDVNLEIREGEYLSVLGPSGSGKSTLMNIIGCLDTATSGSYILGGQLSEDMTEGELADLRDLVFNRSVEDPERLEQAEAGCDFPYTVKKRTLVFGGHEAFRKAIRPMFPTVRFMDPDSLTFSPDLIRNADVVWVQSNCISHSQYWSIVKTCRQAGVQMRYFGFASAEKCAEQLVKEDMK